MNARSIKTALFIFGITIMSAVQTMQKDYLNDSNPSKLRTLYPAFLSLFHKERIGSTIIYYITGITEDNAHDLMALSVKIPSTQSLTFSGTVTRNKDFFNKNGSEYPITTYIQLDESTASEYWYECHILATQELLQKPHGLNLQVTD